MTILQAWPQDSQNPSICHVLIDDSQESSVINTLRKEIRDLEKQLKATPDRDTLAAELKAELASDNATIALLEGYGHPAGILDAVKGKLGENEVTKESVAEALTSIGYQVEVDDASSNQDGQESTENADLAKVSSLSAQVQSAAQGGGAADVTTRLNQATTQDEIAAIMAEAGLLQDHTP